VLDQNILAINAGSSSLKFGLYAPRSAAGPSSAPDETRVLDGQADGIGRPSGHIELKDVAGRTLRSETANFRSQDEALTRAAQWLAEFSNSKPVAIGHRIVHGGPRLITHQRITPALIDDLRSCVHFAPLHIPAALALIASTEKLFPTTPQFACFDTAFHTTMPESAAHLPLPQDLYDEGIRRYGFHGLSYESIVRQLGKDLPPRTVVAHLGNGASLCAIQNGRSIDTSMGLTPTGGIPMATRSGDLDPGVLLYLLRVKKLGADSLEKVLNHDSGLIALSAGKSDMRDLESAAASGDAKSRLAIEIFCNEIRKTIAAYAAALAGLDLIVFTGGIGEHAPLIRAKISEGLSFLGLTIDTAANAAASTADNNAGTPRVTSIISTPSSAISVRVIATQEDAQIALHSRSLLDSRSLNPHL
jgi:acetate kinase